jgi:hypothetical protein
MELVTLYCPASKMLICDRVVLSRPAANTSLPTGRQADPCNAGFIYVEWVIDDFTKSELQPSWWTIVLDIKKVPLQGSYSVPTGSAFAFYCNVKVSFRT